MKGIILKTTPFKETGKVCKLFSEEVGILSFLLKKIPKTNHLLQTLSSPLSYSEFHLAKQKSELYLFHDATLITPFLGLRESFEKLSAGQELLHIISLSQLPEKPAPALFKLLVTYLKRLESTLNPLPLVLSFTLKTLFHDGLLPARREDFPPFQDNDWLTLKALLESRDFASLESLTISPLFREQVSSFFLNSLDLV